MRVIDFEIREKIRDWEDKHNFNEKEFAPGSGYSFRFKEGTTKVFYDMQARKLTLKLTLMSTKPGAIIGKAGSTINELKEALKPYHIEVSVKELKEYI